MILSATLGEGPGDGKGFLIESDRGFFLGGFRSSESEIRFSGICDRSRLRVPSQETLNPNTQALKHTKL